MAQRELVRDWIERLRSGEYNQTRETLCDGTGYCCLGVAVEGVLGYEWQHVEETDNPVYKVSVHKDHDDYSGEDYSWTVYHETELAEEDAEALGLHTRVDSDELKVLHGVIQHMADINDETLLGLYYAPTTRENVLIRLNDEHKFSFDMIADFIEKMAWDKE